MLTESNWIFILRRRRRRRRRRSRHLRWEAVIIALLLSIPSTNIVVFSAKSKLKNKPSIRLHSNYIAKMIHSNCVCVNQKVLLHRHRSS